MKKQAKREIKKRTSIKELLGTTSLRMGGTDIQSGSLARAISLALIN